MKIGDKVKITRTAVKGEIIDGVTFPYHWNPEMNDAVDKTGEIIGINVSASVAKIQVDGMRYVYWYPFGILKKEDETGDIEEDRDIDSLFAEFNIGDWVVVKPIAELSRDNALSVTKYRKDRVGNVARITATDFTDYSVEIEDDYWLNIEWVRKATEDEISKNLLPSTEDTSTEILPNLKDFRAGRKVKVIKSVETGDSFGGLVFWDVWANAMDNFIGKVSEIRANANDLTRIQVRNEELKDWFWFPCWALELLPEDTVENVIKEGDYVKLLATSNDFLEVYVGKIGKVKSVEGNGIIVSVEFSEVTDVIHPSPFGHDWQFNKRNLQKVSAPDVDSKQVPAIKEFKVGDLVKAIANSDDLRSVDKFIGHVGRITHVSRITEMYGPRIFQVDFSEAEHLYPTGSKLAWGFYSSDIEHTTLQFEKAPVQINETVEEKQFTSSQSLPDLIKGDRVVLTSRKSIGIVQSSVGREVDTGESLYAIQFSSDSVRQIITGSQIRQVYRFNVGDMVTVNTRELKDSDALSRVKLPATFQVTAINADSTVNILYEVIEFINIPINQLTVLEDNQITEKLVVPVYEAETDDTVKKKRRR
jgi:hypothetical protein